MEKTLEQYMQEETTEQLFYYFKHDGPLNFEKRLIAGKILKERGYDYRSLKQEKGIIVDALKLGIRDYENIDKSKDAIRKKLNGSIAFGLAYPVFWLMYDYIKSIVNDEPFVFTGSIFVISALILYSFYSFFTYQRKVQKMEASNKEDLDIKKLRLSLIERDWHFER